MTQSKDESREQAQRVAASRHMSKSERESRRRRLVIYTTAVSVAVVVLAISIGAFYDTIYVPSQPVVSVGNVTLTREQYVREKRMSLTANMSQNLLLATFGGQFAERFQQQNPFLERQITTTTFTEAPDDQIVNDWVQAETLRQAAKAQFDLVYSDDAAFQAFISDYGMVFAPTPTVDPQPPTEVPTVTPGGPTVTASPEPTQPPPTPTYDGPKAKSEADKMVDTIFTNYQTSMQQANMTGSLTREDFIEALRRQYAHQTLIQRVQGQLIKTEEFTPSTEPSGYDTSHILVRVDVPEGATDADIEALFASKKPQADSLLAKIRAGDDFATLAETASEDFTSRARGGKLDVFDKNGQSVAGSMYDMNYVSAAIALAEGEVVAAPVRTQFGWHIIKLNVVNVPTLDEQLRKARTDAYEKWIADQALQYVASFNIPATATVELVATDAPAPLPTAPLGGYPTSTITPIPSATVEAATATVTP